MLSLERSHARFASHFDIGDAQVICRLEVQPRARIATKVARKPHCGIGADTAPLANDVVDARSRHVQGLRQRIGACTKRNQKILSQYLAGRIGRMPLLIITSSPSVVVNDLDLLQPGRRPAKTKAELIVDADAVPSSAATLQRFEPVTCAIFLSRTFDQRNQNSVNPQTKENAMTAVYKGIFPALQCPFDQSLSIDEPELGKFASWLAGHEGIGGLVTNGHTGEVSH